MRTGQGAGSAGWGGGGGGLGGGEELGAAGAVVRIGSGALVIVAASAMASSLHFSFDFDFLVFFGHAGISEAAGVHLSCGAMKLSARRRVNLRPRGGASRANRGEALRDPVGVNLDELGRASWGRWKAVLPCVLCLKYLVASFSVGRVANVARS